MHFHKCLYFAQLFKIVYKAVYKRKKYMHTMLKYLCLYFLDQEIAAGMGLIFVRGQL